MFNFTDEERELLLCAFNFNNIHCSSGNCLLSDRCGNTNEVYNLGIELLKKLGITDDNK
jgi:hypothetical protein